MEKDAEDVKMKIDSEDVKIENLKPVQTYLFLDLEASYYDGQAKEEQKIRELAMIAVDRKHLLSSPHQPKTLPRIKHKFVMCFNTEDSSHTLKEQDPNNPERYIRYNLDTEPIFNEYVATTISRFISILRPPVCMIAHCGHTHDFVILRSYFTRIGVCLPQELTCVDSIYAFYDIDEVNMQRPAGKGCVRGDYFYTPNKNPNLCYGLGDIYRRLIGRNIEAHQAENDCIMMAEIAIKYGQSFIEYVDKNQCRHIHNDAEYCK